ncbi:MAG: sigma factor-like helix-turn-helix DNA-binding protein, partial [Bacteroidota bacterium]
EGADIAEPDDRFLNELQASRTTKLKKALERVSDEDRDLLTMKYYQNVSIKDLMERLQITESAVKMRLARARQRIKNLISEAEAIEDTFQAPRTLMPGMIADSMMNYRTLSSVA